MLPPVGPPRLMQRGARQGLSGGELVDARDSKSDVLE